MEVEVAAAVLAVTDAVVDVVALGVLLAPRRCQSCEHDGPNGSERLTRIYAVEGCDEAGAGSIRHRDGEIEQSRRRRVACAIQARDRCDEMVRGAHVVRRGNTCGDGDVGPDVRLGYVCVRIGISKAQRKILQHTRPEVDRREVRPEAVRIDLCRQTESRRDVEYGLDVILGDDRDRKVRARRNAFWCCDTANTC